MRHGVHQMMQNLLLVCVVGIATPSCVPSPSNTSPPVNLTDDPLLSPFKDKVPPTRRPDLGSVILADGGPSLLNCFTGAGEEENASLDSLRAIYVDNRSGNLEGRFRGLFEITRDRTSRDSVSVVLQSLEVASLEEIYARPCAEFTGTDTDSTTIYSVVVQAMSAGGIRVDQYGEGGWGIDFNSQYGGQEVLSSRREDGYVKSRTYEGTSIYFAHFLRPYRVTRIATHDTLSSSSRGRRFVALNDCGFTLSHVDPSDWEGYVSCPSGQFELEGRINGYDDTRIVSGVSVAVRVRYLADSLGAVDVFWFRVWEVPLTPGDHPQFTI